MRALLNTDLNTSHVPYLCQPLTLPILLTNLLCLLLLKILPPHFCYLKFLFLLWDKILKKESCFVMINKSVLLLITEQTQM